VIFWIPDHGIHLRTQNRICWMNGREVEQEPFKPWLEELRVKR
jgi:hypothetical protein